MPKNSVLVELNAAQAQYLQSLAQMFIHMANGELQPEAITSDHDAPIHFKSILEALNNPVSPTVVLGMEGDWVQGGTANTPVQVVLIDHDRSNDDSDRAREIPILIDPSETDELLQQEGLGENDDSDSSPNTPRPHA